MKKGILLFWVLSIMLFSCSVNVNDNLTDENFEVSTDNLKLSKSIPPHIFDWEAVDIMPTGPDVTIHMPWAGSNCLFDPQITYDYRKSDGWKLLYNTFNPAGPFVNGSYFALYNQYRGVLRFYSYIRPNNNFYSTYIEDNILVYSPNGKTTSIWNFADNEVADPANNSMKSQSIKGYPVPSDGGWLVSEFDVAYDPNLKNLINTDIWLLQTVKFWNIEKTTLTGNISGTAEQVSLTTTPAFSIENFIKNTATSPLTVFAVMSSLNKDGLNAIYKTEFEKAKKSGASALIKGITNLILTGNPNSGTTQMNYKINLTAKCEGTNTSGGAVKTNFQIAMPGTGNATKGSGAVPVDNLPLGVYNLPSRPLVMVKNNKLYTVPQCLAQYGMGLDPYEYTFYLNYDFLRSICPSYTNNVFNPEFLKVARISQGWTYYWTGSGAPGPKLEILVAATNNNIPASSRGNYGPITICGKKDCSYIPSEYINGIFMKNITPARNGQLGGIIGNGMFRNDTPVYLRITFDVIPKDGSPKTTIIKTFKCDVSSWS